MPLVEHNVNYKGLNNEEIQFIESPSWGGSLTWVNLMFSGVTVYGLLAIIIMVLPVINIFGFIYFVRYSRKIIWEKRGWKSFNEYKASQITWDKGAKTYWRIALIFLISVSLLFLLFRGNIKVDSGKIKNQQENSFKPESCPEGTYIAGGGTIKLSKEEECKVENKTTALPIPSNQGTSTSNQTKPATPSKPACSQSYLDAELVSLKNQYDSAVAKAKNDKDTEIARLDAERASAIAGGAWGEYNQAQYEGFKADTEYMYNQEVTTAKDTYEMWKQSAYKTWNCS